MTALAQRLKDRFFGDALHPYVIFENEVNARLNGDATLLDAGCGRAAPVLIAYRGRAKRLIGIDIVDFITQVDGVELHRCDLARIPIEGNSVDVVMARSVMEHVTDPASVYGEVHRVLKPGGHFVFLTANLLDYASLIAKVIPNRLHPWIVERTEGRDEEDVFPIAYRTNTRRSVHRLAKQAGLDVESFGYLGQNPSYFMFNGPLFLLATGYEKLIGKIPVLKPLQGWILATLRKPIGA